MFVSSQVSATGAARPNAPEAAAEEPGPLRVGPRGAAHRLRRGRARARHQQRPARHPLPGPKDIRGTDGSTLVRFCGLSFENSS